jgi:multidrug efflux pump subunit AcrB
MISLTELSLQKNRLTLLCMVSVIIAGILLYIGFPKRESPEVAIRTSVVTVSFAGMAPKKMEQLIALPVERKIREISEVEDINTLISTGQLNIKVDLNDSVLDLEPIWQELRDKMEEVERELPEGSMGPFVNTNFGDVSVASIAVTAEGFGYRDMELVAQRLQRKLYEVDGVSKAELFGVQEERIWIELDTDRVAAVGKQMQSLIDDMQQQNVIFPAGTINAEGTSLLLEASGDFGSIDDIEKMLTKLEGEGEFAQLRDLVKVRRGVVSPQQQSVFFNGRPAVVVSVNMDSRYDIEKLGRELIELEQREENLLPIGYELNFATFQPTKVEKAVNKALSNVLQTFFIVLIVMTLFLGVRSSLVISSIVVFSVMFTLIGMNLLGLSLEQISIAAIIISLGLLVDNGIVVVEDIQKRMADGNIAYDAALESGKQFAVPLLISTLTTIFAFLPFFLLEGAEGDYAFSLGAVVTVTLIGSWISAVFFLPLMALRTLKAGSDKGGDDGAAAFFLNQPYRRMLQGAMRFSPLVIIVSYVLVLVSIVMMLGLRSEMFPPSDRNQLLVYVDMPKGTYIDSTQETVQAVTDWIGDSKINPEVVSQIAYVGSGGPRFYLTLNPLDPAPEVAFILVNTKDFAGTRALSSRIRKHVMQLHPEARFKLKRLSMGASESGIVDVEISGSGLDTLLSLAHDVEAMFRDAPDITQNENDWGNKIVKVLIDIDQDKARRAGVTSESMAQGLLRFFDGYTISEYREDDQSIPIVLRAELDNRSRADDLYNIPFDAKDGLVRLEQVSNALPQVEYSQIRRKNQVRTVIVSAKSASLTAHELLALVQPQLDELDLSGGYSIDIGGEISSNDEINQMLAAGIPFALFLMMAVIMFQFNSIRKTLTVFMTIPLIIIGIPYGLLLSGQPLSFFGTLGIISLAGIIINNSIVLIDQIDIERLNKSLDDAIAAAALKRMRPILLTSATTVLGLMPLYLFGDDLWSPLAVVMMSGLAVASVITLFFVPACYRLMYLYSKQERPGVAL